MSAEIFVIVWLATAAAWLFFCGYNGIADTPAPFVGLLWPALVIFAVIYSPIWLGKRVRAALLKDHNA